MQSMTLDELSGQLGRSVYEHVTDLAGSVEIPLSDGPVSQGDVRVRTADSTPAVRVRKDAAWAPVPASGVPVVSGQHDHVLAPGLGGSVRWTTDVSDETGLAVGVAEVTGSAYVWHAEHGGVGVLPGTYVVRRQREQAAEQRLVAD